MWHEWSWTFNNWKMHWGRHYQQCSRVTRLYETRNLPQAATTRWWCGQVVVTTTTTSCKHWCGWIALRCDMDKVDKAARPYRHTSLTRKWRHRQSFQVPRFGHDQVWTDHTGTRFSTHCKRTSISARTERRRSHEMELVRVSSLLWGGAVDWVASIVIANA